MESCINKALANKLKERNKTIKRDRYAGNRNEKIKPADITLAIVLDGQRFLRPLSVRQYDILYVGIRWLRGAAAPEGPMT